MCWFIIPSEIGEEKATERSEPGLCVLHKNRWIIFRPIFQGIGWQVPERREGRGKAQRPRPSFLRACHPSPYRLLPGRAPCG